MIIKCLYNCFYDGIHHLGQPESISLSHGHSYLIQSTLFAYYLWDTGYVLFQQIYLTFTFNFLSFPSLGDYKGKRLRTYSSSKVKINGGHPCQRKTGVLWTESSKICSNSVYSTLYKNSVRMELEV